MTSRRSVTLENLGAWLFKCAPDTWDVASYIADGHRTVDRWAVRDSYRLDLFEKGQRAFLWASAGFADVASGVIGEGVVTGRFIGGDANGYWVSDDAIKTGRFAELEMTLFNTVVERPLFLADPQLAQAEVIRQPVLSNPSYLSRDQVAALDRLMGR